MQVKQQKKSSNKWNCVICNQKQSVKKIYAEGYQAKEIRLFVQSFNMSRKDADEIAAIECETSSVGHFVEHLEGVRVQDEHKAKKRSDWSEYIENEEHTRPACLTSLPNGPN
uniref:MRN complex-interacting protein N-terminal domain-containing protein n=1 Tax=Opuntia streptacantha TaxID=393608 RepID=A0A7C8YBT2_OPUST